MTPTIGTGLARRCDDRPAPFSPPDQGRRGGRARPAGVTLCDLVVGMAILLFVATAVVAGPFARAREQANRGCATFGASYQLT